MVITLINLPMSVLCLFLPILSWSSVVVDRTQIPKLGYSWLGGGETTATSSALNVRIWWWYTVTHSKLTNSCGRNYPDILFHLNDLITSKEEKWFDGQKKRRITTKGSWVLLPVLSLTDLAGLSMWLSLVHLPVNSCSKAGHSNTEEPQWNGFKFN